MANSIQPAFSQRALRSWFLGIASASLQSLITELRLSVYFVANGRRPKPGHSQYSRVPGGSTKCALELTWSSPLHPPFANRGPVQGTQDSVASDEGFRVSSAAEDVPSTIAVRGSYRPDLWKLPSNRRRHQRSLFGTATSFVTDQTGSCESPLSYPDPN